MFTITEKATGRTVEPGETVTSFRGETATLIRAIRAADDGRTGKVEVVWSASGSRSGSRGEYYDNVFGLAVSGDATVTDAQRAAARDAAGLAPRDSFSYGR